MLKKYFLLFFVITVFIASCSSCHQPAKEAATSALMDTLVKMNPAIGNINKQIKSNPQNAELYYSRGLILDQMQQFTLAAADLHKAIELDAKQVRYYLIFADINISAHHVDVAVDYLKRAKKLEPENREIRMKLAKAYLYLKEYESVLIETNEVLAVDRNNANCFLLQGMVWKEKGDTAKAINTYKLSADADPDNYEIQMQLGLLNDFHNKKLAEKYFLNAIRLDSNKYEANYALAMHYQNNNEIKKAIKQYNKLILLDPQNAQPYYNLGCVYLYLDSIKKAFSDFNIAVLNAPANADCVYQRGLCWEMRGNKVEAAKDFQSAINLRSGFKEAVEALKRVKK